MREMGRGVWSLEPIATTSPLLGCLGTVVWVGSILIGGNDEKVTHCFGTPTDAFFDGFAFTIAGCLAALPAWLGSRYLVNTLESFRTELEIQISEVRRSGRFLHGQK